MAIVTLLNCDARAIALADESVQCVVTSPPYWNLRDYGTAEWVGGDAACEHRPPDDAGRTNKPTKGQREHAGRFSGAKCWKCGARRVDRLIGLEGTPGEYVASIVAVMREVWRVLRPDGTVWLNLGDSYVSSPRGNKPGDYSTSSLTNPDRQDEVARLSKPARIDGLKTKDLVGIPWRVAFALQEDGWWLRSDIIWSKPNPMPESVTDRPTKAHEYIFMLSKRARYFYDAEAGREPQTGNAHSRGNGHTPKEAQAGSNIKSNASFHEATSKYVDVPGGRNRRSVWTIATSPYSGAHFATFPPDLVEPMILAGTSARGCCPACGAPWFRVVERNDLGFADRTFRSPHRTDTPGMTNGQGATTLAHVVEHGTLGWLPSCDHYGVHIPDEVLYLPEEPDEGRPRSCETCGGSGTLAPLPMFPDRVVCRECGGTGGEQASAERLAWSGECERVGEIRRRLLEKIDQESATVPCRVLDPFSGTATAGRVAVKLGRDFMGCEINGRYIEMGKKRTSGVQVGLGWT